MGIVSLLSLVYITHLWSMHNCISLTVCKKYALQKIQFLLQYSNNFLFILNKNTKINFTNEAFYSCIMLYIWWLSNELVRHWRCCSDLWSKLPLNVWTAGTPCHPFSSSSSQFHWVGHAEHWQLSMTARWCCHCGTNSGQKACHYLTSKSSESGTFRCEEPRIFPYACHTIFHYFHLPCRTLQVRFLVLSMFWKDRQRIAHLLPNEHCQLKDHFLKIYVICIHVQVIW